jgi:dTDP-glucose pyrophosphorylase
VLRLLSPTCVVVVAETQTSGAACTALLAIEHIDTDDPLVIANGDQIIDADLGKVLCDFRARDLDGGIIVFDAVHPRWSYVRVDEEGNVREAAEKRPISRHATAGFYYFRSGRTFVEAAKDMIRKDDQVNGAFYVCPVYNQMILRQAKVGIYTIPRNAYHSLATPRGVDAYHKLISGKETIAEI